MNRPLLITNATIAVPGSAPRVLQSHELLVEHGRIGRIAPRVEVDRSRFEIIDATGLLVLPGFINLHTHCYSTFARGFTAGAPAREFMEVLQSLWWRLDKALTLDDCSRSALPVLIDSIRRGTTTIIDHHASPRAIRGSLAELGRAAETTGVRTCLCYEVSDRDGTQAAAEGIAENVEWLAACAEGKGLQRALFGLHASFTLSDATLGTAVAAARISGAGFHVHAAESPVDQVISLRTSGHRVVERLHEAGVLGPSTIAAHCVDVDDREMDILAETSTVVAHNPQSNMNNAVGIADVAGMYARGIAVGLGTDAMTADMREELRVGIWGQRLRTQDASAGFSELVNALWTVNPSVAGRLWGIPVGVLEEGAAADIILVEYAPPTPLTDASLHSHLVFGLAGAQVVTTIVDGRVLMRDRRLLLDLDEQEVAAEARAAAKEVWKRME